MRRPPRASRDRFGEDAERFDLPRPADDGRDPGLPPRLQPIPDALRRTDQRHLVGELVGHGGGGFLLLPAEVEVLDLLRFRFEAVAAGEVVVEVLAARSHAADVEREARLDVAEAFLDVGADHDVHRCGDVEARERLPAAGAREARVVRALEDVRPVRRVPARQPAVGDLGRLLDALWADRRDVNRDLPPVEDALEGLPEPGGPRPAIRDLVVLALVLDRLLAGPDLPDDVDVLPGLHERLAVRLAVPALDDLRARDAEAE